MRKIQKKDSSGTKKIKNVVVKGPDTETEENFKNIVLSTYESNTFPDGLIEILMDDQLYNGAQLEITYTISVDNRSEYDTLRWVVNGNKKLAVIYYEGENYEDLPFYEDGKVIYHNDNEKKYEKTEGTVNPDGEDSIVRTSANNIVDFIEPNLQFATQNFLHEEINENWELTTANDFISSREKNDELMSGYNQFVRAKDTSPLLEKLKPRDPVLHYRQRLLKQMIMNIIT